MRFNFGRLIECIQPAGHHVVHWSRLRALGVLIAATILMACCADLCTQNIEPILTHSFISQVIKILPSSGTNAKCRLGSKLKWFLVIEENANPQFKWRFMSRIQELRRK